MANRSRMKRRAAPISTEPDGGQDRPPSKTTLKKQAHALQELGEALSRLPAERRALIQMPEELRDAIDLFLKTRAHEARRRQLQLIGKILRGIDPTPIKAAVDAFRQGKAADAQSLHRIERWRDELIDGDEAVTRWMESYPDTDVQQLRNLIRNARQAGAGEDPEQRQPKSYRELFRLIRQTLAQADPE
jgi:ribosome-associated protein